jgi:hypothetical protein
MSSDHDEVRRILKSIPKLLSTCNEPITAQAIGNSLYGLRNMKSDHECVKNVIKCLPKLYLTCTESLTSQNIGKQRIFY